MMLVGAILLLMCVLESSSQSAVCRAPVSCNCGNGKVSCRGNRKVSALPDMSRTSYTELYFSGSSIKNVQCRNIPESIELLDLRRCPNLSAKELCSLLNCSKLQPSRAVFLHRKVSCSEQQNTSSTAAATAPSGPTSASIDSKYTSSPRTVPTSPIAILSTLSPSDSWTTAEPRWSSLKLQSTTKIHSPKSEVTTTTSTSTSTSTTVSRTPEMHSSTRKLLVKTTNRVLSSFPTTQSSKATPKPTSKSITDTTTPETFRFTNVQSMTVTENVHVSVTFVAPQPTEGASLTINQTELISEHNAIFSAQNAPKSDKSGAVVGLSVFGSVVTVLGVVGGLILFYWHRKRMDAQARHYTITMQNLFGVTLKDLERRKEREELRAEARRRSFQGQRLLVSNELSPMGVPPSTSAGPSDWVSFSDEVLDAVNGSAGPQVTVTAEVHPVPVHEPLSENDEFHSIENSSQNSSQESNEPAEPFLIDLGIVESTV